MKDQHRENAEQLDKIIRSQGDIFSFALYLVKVSYGTVIEILRTCFEGFFNIADPNLNHSYIQCLRQIRMVLGFEKKIYEEIGDPPQLFESLVGNIEEADIEWELGLRQAANEYYGKIENAFIKYGSRTYELPEFIQKFFDYTKKAIDNHRKTEAVYREVFDLVPEKTRVIKYGSITVDVEKSTLQYKTNPPITVSLGTNEIVFLVKLLEKRGKVFKYEDITKIIPTSSDDELPSRKANILKRNLRKYLLRAGMNEKEISRTIIAVRSVGYRFASS